MGEGGRSEGSTGQSLLDMAEAKASKAQEKEDYGPMTQADQDETVRPKLGDPGLGTFR